MISQNNGWLDVTETISKNTVVWPGDPNAIISRVAGFELGDDYQLSEVFMSVHTGTHVDAPLHFIPEGKDITQISPEALMGEAIVLDVSHQQTISVEWLMTKALQKGTRVLFKTIRDDANRNEELSKSDFVAIDVAAAYFLAELGILLVGIDGLSIAPSTALMEVHTVFLKKEIVIVEVLHLKGIAEGLYEMICLPIKIEGAEAAPARVLLRKM